jgi:hypothetical protein
VGLADTSDAGIVVLEGTRNPVDTVAAVISGAVPGRVTFAVGTGAPDDGSAVPGKVMLAVSTGTPDDGAAVPGKVTLAVSVGKPEEGDRERERPSRSPSPGLYDPVDVFSGGGTTLEFRDSGGTVIDGKAGPVPVGSMLVRFPVMGVTAVDATKPLPLGPTNKVVFAVGVERPERAVTPVASELVEFTDATGIVLDPVPIGKLMFAEAVGTLEEGAVTPVKKVPVEFADSVGMTADSVGPFCIVKPPPVVSALEFIDTVGKTLTAVPSVEETFTEDDGVGLSEGASPYPT